jgi:hypothetical protein
VPRRGALGFVFAPSRRQVVRHRPRVVKRLPREI